MSSPGSAGSIHIFDNGVKVYRHHLIAPQLERYARINLHEPEEEELFVRIIKGIDAEGGVFLNIGAAIGYYVILARRLHPKLEIHAFEPLAEHLNFMGENLKLNGISTEGIHIHNVAVSSRDGDASFCRQSYGSSLIQEKHLRLPDPPASLQTTVTVTMLDTFQKELGKPIDFVQMDVQGFEFDVLSGSIQTLKNRLVKTWMVGTHDKRLHDGCKALLESNGCRIVYDDLNTKHQPDGILVATVG